MLEKIKQTLQGNKNIKAWIIRQETINSSQQYELKDKTESLRAVNTESYTIDVLCDSKDAEDKPSSGLGTISILPGGEIESAIEKAVLTAQLVHNEPYDFAAPASIPEIELADEEYLKDPAGEIKKILSTLKETTASYPHVRLTAAECFGQEKIIHLISSKGIDAKQKETEIYLQWVYIGGTGEEEVETFAEIYRRRISDLNLKEEAALRAQYTSDLLVAEGPTSYSGPIVVQGPTLTVMVAGEMLAGSVIDTLSSAALKYSGETPWEIGQSIFREDVKGDDFNLWANRQLPYGIPSNAFDKEGIPAQRIALVKDNKLASFIADQRYAHYMNLTPGGSFGSMEIPAGKTPLAEFQVGSYIEIAEYSWFNPNSVTGDFACEIRLGYIIEDGVKKPFKGGLLVGNLLDALADMNWSQETGFYGNYLGPRAARFNNLKIAG
ncbi:MAG: metallopeptidase TldD-related protein [Anaerolineales bacterium]|nr:metallopeptidase TldD-related protein [Anaerolineales bacterium]